jgi:dCMP deaminase
MRASWDAYFMDIAAKVATRATCPRASVGAVLVRDNRMLSAGYNGSPSGLPHCTDVDCLLENGHCVRTIHAEANAIIQAALHGISTEGATLYVSHLPCLSCTKMLINAGIWLIIFGDPYRVSSEALAMLDAARVGYRQHIG